MNLTPVSEISSTAEYEEEKELVGIISQASSVEKKAETKPKVVTSLTMRQLEEENEELRIMCRHLGEAYQKSKQLEQEWQSFGKYTAAVLKEELATSESRSLVTREELQRLSRDNRELKEMCLFLDQSKGGGNDGTNSLTPPEAMEIILHGKIAGEINRVQGQVPRYTGRTQHTTLKDSEAIRMGLVSERNKEMALTEMKRRLDRLETERLELIKSLSAAHTLAADTGLRGGEGVASGHRDRLPAHVQQKLDDIMHDGKNVEQGNDSLAVPPDIIQNAVTLLDVVRRLDATTACGFSDGVTEAEAVALRLLVNIAWQKIQESVNRK